jgi:hypothetical protein
MVSDRSAIVDTSAGIVQAIISAVFVLAQRAGRSAAYGSFIDQRTPKERRND